MFRKVIMTKFGTPASYWSPLSVHTSALGSRITIGLWADRDAFNAGGQPLEVRDVNLVGDNNPFPVDSDAVRSKIRVVLRTLSDFQDATDED